MSGTFAAYARYYDLLYRDKDYEGETDFVHGLLTEHGVAAGAAILELGCGTGRHAVHLARRGHAVMGYDISKEMVATARDSIPADLATKLRFEVADVRSLDAGQKFDAVVSLFHVVSYQTETESVAAMFASAARHLRPGGVFLFDCWYGPAVLSSRPEIRIKRLADDNIDVTRIAEPVEHVNENCVDVRYSVFVKEKSGGRTEVIEETHRMRYFFAPELRLLLLQAGFAVVREAEWLTGGPLGPGTWSATVLATRT